MKFLTNILLSVILLVVSSCNGCKQIPANQVVLTTNDYGKTWRQLASTETVPAYATNSGRNVYLPLSTMTGELKTKQRIGAPGKGAIAYFKVTYLWEISDFLLFMTEAKELAKGGDYTSDSSLEGIESRLIDRHIVTAMGPVLAKEPNVKDFDAGVFGTNFEPVINEDLSKYGIKITGSLFVAEYGAQLEMAIDAAQALEMYDAIGEPALGRELMKAQAGATKVNVTVEDKDQTEQ